MLAKRRGLGTNDVSVLTGKLRIKTRGKTNGHRQGSSGRLGCPSPIPTPTGPLVIRKRDPQFLDTLYMALYLNLGHEPLLSSGLMAFISSADGKA